VPLQEGDACGDAWAVRHSGGRDQILVVDGLGHGLLASQAADTALRVFEESDFAAPADIVKSMHGPLRSTRGASLALADVNYSSGQILYAGVGNISGVILRPGGTRSMVSHNGTVGHELHRVEGFAYPWSPDVTLVFHSDGLLSRWQLDPYPGLLARHPSIIAGILYRDFQRGRDDVTIVVSRTVP
jgi:serine phosphatase RsbU (regulator of sigma subunit)